MEERGMTSRSAIRTDRAPSLYESPWSLFEVVANEFEVYTINTTFGQCRAPGHPSFASRERMIENHELVSMFGRMLERNFRGFETDFCSNLWNKIGLAWADPILNGICVAHDLFYFYGRNFAVDDTWWWAQSDRWLADAIRRRGQQKGGWFKPRWYRLIAITHHLGPRLYSRYLVRQMKRAAREAKR